MARYATAHVFGQIDRWIDGKDGSMERQSDRKAETLR